MHPFISKHAHFTKNTHIKQRSCRPRSVFVVHKLLSCTNSYSDLLGYSEVMEPCSSPNRQLHLMSHVRAEMVALRGGRLANLQYDFQNCRETWRPASRVCLPEQHTCPKIHEISSSRCLHVGPLAYSAYSRDSAVFSQRHGHGMRRHEY